MKYIFVLLLLLMSGCTCETIFTVKDADGVLHEVARIKQDSQGAAEYIEECVTTIDKEGSKTITKRITVRADTDEDGNFFTRNVGSVVRDTATTVGSASPF